MSHQIKISLANENSSSTALQPIVITWTNPSTENQSELIDETHIKQEDELQILTQVIQQVSHPGVAAAASEEQPESNLTRSRKKFSEIFSKLAQKSPKKSNNGSEFLKISQVGPRRSMRISPKASNGTERASKNLGISSQKIDKTKPKLTQNFDKNSDESDENSEEAQLDPIIPEICKKFVKILPKSGNEVDSQKIKEKYLQISKRRYSKKTPEELLLNPQKKRGRKPKNSFKLDDFTEAGTKVDEKYIKREKELDIDPEVEAVLKYVRETQKLKNSEKNSEKPTNFSVIKDEAVEEVTVKVVDLDQKIKEEPTEFVAPNSDIQSFTITEVPTTPENVLLANTKFIRTTSPSGTIKLTTVPSSSSNLLRSPPSGLKIAPVGTKITNLSLNSPKNVVVSPGIQQNMKFTPITPGSAGLTSFPLANFKVTAVPALKIVNIASNLDKKLENLGENSKKASNLGDNNIITSNLRENSSITSRLVENDPKSEEKVNLTLNSGEKVNMFIKLEENSSDVAKDSNITLNYGEKLNITSNSEKERNITSNLGEKGNIFIKLEESSSDVEKESNITLNYGEKLNITSNLGENVSKFTKLANKGANFGRSDSITSNVGEIRNLTSNSEKERNMTIKFGEKANVFIKLEENSSDDAKESNITLNFEKSVTSKSEPNPLLKLEKPQNIHNKTDSESHFQSESNSHAESEEEDDDEDEDRLVIKEEEEIQIIDLIDDSEEEEGSLDRNEEAQPSYSWNIAVGSQISSNFALGSDFDSSESSKGAKTLKKDQKNNLKPQSTQNISKKSQKVLEKPSQSSTTQKLPKNSTQTTKLTTKRHLTSDSSENPSKKLKFEDEQHQITIIPYIPPTKPRRISSTSSSDGSAASATHPFQCKMCLNTFKRKIDMIHHLKSHTEAKFECQKCGMKFKFEGYFQKHKCITCNLCDKTFFLKQQLRNHKRNFHNIQMDMYECDLCGKMLRYRHGVLYHMSKTHMLYLEDKFECDVCGKRFKLKESIRLHIKNHESVIECKLCGKKVKRVNLNVHNKSVHVTERKFKCRICKMSFKTKECLKSHVRTHEKNFGCTECGKKFANKSHLKEHSEWHKNPDAFKCKICNKSFSQKYCLKAHIKLHESGHAFTKFKCTLCSYTTDKAENYEKHELKHKRQEENQEMKKNWVQCEKCPLKFRNKLKLATHCWKKHSEVLPK